VAFGSGTWVMGPRPDLHPVHGVGLAVWVAVP
jgi:hypothetical protein